MIAPATGGLVDCPMLRTVADRPTDYWNDSCSVTELEYAVARGATGATSNPSIVLEVLGKERSYWEPRVREIAAADPTASEIDVTWAVIEEMAVRGAAVLEPVYVREGGHKGRLSLQTNPANFTNRKRMLEQGLRFASLAPNMQVKFPATRAGIATWKRPRPPASASTLRSASRSPRRSPSRRPWSVAWTPWLPGVRTRRSSRPCAR
jgi:hypothetical protein